MRTRAKWLGLLAALGLAACVLMGCATQNTNGLLPAIEVQPDPEDVFCMTAAKADLNGDGVYEDYRYYSIGHGIIRFGVSGHDTASDKEYHLEPGKEMDYHLVLYDDNIYIVTVPGMQGGGYALEAVVCRPSLDEENQEFLLTEVTGELAEQVLNALRSRWEPDAA